MNDEPSLYPYGDSLSRNPRDLARFVVTSTALVLWWCYLVIGEFVLSGLPEWLGWTMLIGIGFTCHLLDCTRFCSHEVANPWLQLCALLVQAALMFLATLLAASVVGLVLPEPATTAITFIGLCAAALWQHKKRLRLFPELPSPSGPSRLIRLVTVAVLTLAAVGAFLSRQ